MGICKTVLQFCLACWSPRRVPFSLLSPINLFPLSLQPSHWSTPAMLHYCSSWTVRSDWKLWRVCQPVGYVLPPKYGITLISQTVVSSCYCNYGASPTIITVAIIYMCLQLGSCWESSIKSLTWQVLNTTECHSSKSTLKRSRLPFCEGGIN